MPRTMDPVTVKVITKAINKLPKFGPLSRRIQQLKSTDIIPGTLPGSFEAEKSYPGALSLYPR